MPRKRDETETSRRGASGPGRHERKVSAQVASWRRSGVLPPDCEHLLTAMRAAGRALDAAEADGNHYGSRQAVRSLLELHEALLGKPERAPESAADWLARMPTVPEDRLS